MSCHRFNMFNWNSILEGETVFIIGNGPSLLEEDLNLLDGRFTIGINRCFKIYDPTILMWQDDSIYIDRGIDQIRESRSVKVCKESVDKNKEFTNFIIQKGNFSFNNNLNILQGYGCTAALSAQLAVSMGAGRLVLIGCDGKYGKYTDFYGDNSNHNPHTLFNFERAYRFIKEKCPIEVTSCCSNDLWKRYSLDSVVKNMTSKKITTVQWISKFLNKENDNLN